MQNMNELFAFAMRMPKQRLAQEMMKPTGAIPPAVAMAALQQMNSQHAAPAQQPTVAQQMAQGASQGAEMQAFASGGIVRLAEGGGVGPAPRGWNNPEYIKQWFASLFGGPAPDPKIAPNPNAGDHIPYSLTPTDNYGPAGPTKAIAERALNKQPNPDDPMLHLMRGIGLMDTPTPSLAKRNPGSYVPDKDTTPVAMPAQEEATPQAPAATPQQPQEAEAGPGGIEAYLDRIKKLMPDRWGDIAARMGTMDADIQRSRANNTPMALMTAGANMLGRRSQYGSEVLGEGVRAGLGAFKQGDEANKKDMMAMLGLSEKVAGTREGNDVKTLEQAVRDRATDEVAASRVAAGRMQREDALTARMIAELNRIEATAVALAKQQIAENPMQYSGLINNGDTTAAIQFLTSQNIALLKAQNPVLLAWEQRMMGGMGGGAAPGANVRRWPGSTQASGGAPAAAGKQ